MSTMWLSEWVTPGDTAIPGANVEGLRPWDWSYPVLRYLREWPTPTVIIVDMALLLSHSIKSLLPEANCCNTASLTILVHIWLKRRHSLLYRSQFSDCSKIENFRSLVWCDPAIIYFGEFWNLKWELASWEIYHIHKTLGTTEHFGN